MEENKGTDEFDGEFPIKKKETIIVLIVISVFVIGVVTYLGWTQPTGIPFSEENSVSRPLAQTSYNDKIKISMPIPNTKIVSPLIVRGEARGIWYFEASFPVKLLDEDGTVLVQTPATAKGEWMTENYVPFEVILKFKAPIYNTGTLVLERDNPSSLPQNADEFRIPVRF